MTFPVLKQEEMKLVSSHDRVISHLPAHSRPQRSGQETHPQLQEPLPTLWPNFGGTKGLLEPGLALDHGLQHPLTCGNEVPTAGKQTPRNFFLHPPLLAA